MIDYTRPDENFRERQKQARVEINKLDAGVIHDQWAGATNISSAKLFQF